jgi:hypothetical protein
MLSRFVTLGEVVMLYSDATLGRLILRQPFGVLKVKGEPAYQLLWPPIAFLLHWVDLFHAILCRVLKEPAFRLS